VLYPKINLWIPKAPKRIPQIPAAIFLLASLELEFVIEVNLYFSIKNHENTDCAS
jgi:hypothetical protein